MAEGDPGNEHVPIFNAPTVVVTLMLAILTTHGLRLIMPDEQQLRLLFDGALVPARLSAMMAGNNDPDAYNVASLIRALFGHTMLHADWMHAGGNAVMGLAVGAPVARAMGGGAGGVGKFALVFFGSAFSGAAFYFALMPADGPLAIGASGGVSGLLAGALLTMQLGRGRILSQRFLMASLGFTIANIALALAGPTLLGMGIAWQAHLGGFVGGAVLFQILRQPLDLE